MSGLPYRQLVVWQKAHELAMDVLKLAETSPLRRRFYFRDQMCDAAMSIPANIAEGNGRSTPADYASFVDRARGSLFELDEWLLAARDNGWLEPALYEQFEPRIAELSYLLLALANSLRARSSLRSRSSPHS